MNPPGCATRDALGRMSYHAERASAPSIMSMVFCDAVGGDERAEARAFLLAEQHLIEHVEPVERDAGLAVLGFFLVVEERLAPADLIDHVLDRLRRCIGRQLRQRIAQIDQRGALGRARLAEFFRRQHEIAEIMDGVVDQRGKMRMGCPASRPADSGR